MRRTLALLAAASLIQAPAAAGWSWPVEGPVLRPFAFGNDPYAAGQHRGIDIGAAPGTTVRAATAGSVSFVGTVPAGGRAVTVRTADGLSVTYLELGATRVERGADIGEGDAIGTIGPAAHLHLGVRVTEDPHGYLDPLQFLPPRPTAVARADPVPEQSAAVVQPEPVAEEVARAEPPAAEATVKPKPEPTPAVPVPSAPAVPSPAPVAAEPAPAPVESAPTPRAKAAESVESTPERTRVAAQRAETSPAPRELTARAGTRDAPASQPVVRRPSSVVSARSSVTPSRRTRARIATPHVRITRVKPKPVVTVVTPEHGPMRSQPRPRLVPRESKSANGIARTLLPALLLLGLVGVVLATLRSRRGGKSILPPSVGRCSLGRICPPRLLHACTRAGDVGRLASATRPRSRVALHRPLPRPRRRVPIHTPS